MSPTCRCDTKGYDNLFLEWIKKILFLLISFYCDYS